MGITASIAESEDRITEKQNEEGMTNLFRLASKIFSLMESNEKLTISLLIPNLTVFRVPYRDRLRGALPILTTISYPVLNPTEQS
jgi:hypothetical protein